MLRINSCSTGTLACALLLTSAKPAQARVPVLLEPASHRLFVIPFTVNVHGEPSKARDLLSISPSKKQQIPRANTALRNEMVRVSRNL